MRRVDCSHCQGTAWGTSANPRFSIKEDFDEDHGYPVVEVLKNGCAIHRFDEHFRFGRRKAEMLLACLPALKEFGWASNEERERFPTRIIEDITRRIKVRVHVEMHPDFEYSTGAKIEQRWLRLQAMHPDLDHLGLGVMKCRAVWSVQDDLRSWLRKRLENTLNSPVIINGIIITPQQQEHIRRLASDPNYLREQILRLRQNKRVRL
jgi:hypothetical protein